MAFKDKEKEAVYIKSYLESHKKDIAVYMKAYRKLNKKKMKAYRESNKKKIVAQRKAYRKLHKEEIAVYIKAYRKLNKEDIIVQRKIYDELHKEERKKYQNVYTNNKYKINYKFRLNINISSRIRQSLKNNKNCKNGHHWEKLVPYTLDDLIKRLKKTLPSGYTWDNYINGKTDLQIDHIIPIAAHNFTAYDHIDFQRCWALKNLQLLPALKNQSKYAKIEKPFQPSLLL